MAKIEVSIVCTEMLVSTGYAAIKIRVVEIMTGCLFFLEYLGFIIFAIKTRPNEQVSPHKPTII